MKENKFKLSCILFILLLILLLPSCAKEESTTTYTLPDLTGKSRSEITTVMDSLGASYLLKFNTTSTLLEKEEYDKFSFYQSGYKAGDIVLSNYQLYIYTTPTLLEESIDFQNLYLDKSQISLDEFTYTKVEGAYISQVKYFRNVDGDTTRFVELNDSLSYSNSFSLRYLGIDTPESTRDHEPWGKAASYYTEGRISKAKYVVLECEKERYTTVGERWLGFVWYGDDLDHLHLLNLELVEHAFSQAMLSTSSKYYKYFLDAGTKARNTGRRVYGEKDPGYDYEAGDFVSGYYELSDFVGMDE